MVTMTQIVYKDEQWLKEQIQLGVQGYLDCEIERIAETVTEYVMRQIFNSSCAEYSESASQERGKVLIESSIPSPEECCQRLDSL